MAERMRTSRVTIIGAGIAGLVAAVRLARAGLEVTVVDRAAAPGGKMREIRVGGQPIDAGPTVFTLRGIFEEIFSSAGRSLDSYLTLKPAEVLARHAWAAGGRLDLFADIDRSADAIADFAGIGEAQAYRRFCARSKQMYDTLDHSFIRAARPSPLGLVKTIGPLNIAALRAISPFSTMWQALGAEFRDPRLRQLFGRYATYCGSSPFQSPATLMLIAHVEQAGVWLVEGGMHQLAVALAHLSSELGATFHYGNGAAEILTDRRGVIGVRLEDGTELACSAVVCTADAAAVTGGLLGQAVTRAVPAPSQKGRALSAVTWTMAVKTEGFPLLRHNVFFSDDYKAEFDAIFRQHRLPDTPTVYICAQDRGDDDSALDRPERLLCLVNAPPTGDRSSFPKAEIASCMQRTLQLLERCGLTLHQNPDMTVATTPAGFEQLFPATGGALYGRASHGWMASFRRPGARTRIPGLYLAGGSVHPGAGVPMAALSGIQAADSLVSDHVSTRSSRIPVMSGGISTP